MSQSLYLLIVPGGNRAEIVDSLIAEEGVGLLFQLGLDKFPLACFVDQLDVHLIFHHFLFHLCVMEDIRSSLFFSSTILFFFS